MVSVLLGPFAIVQINEHVSERLVQLALHLVVLLILLAVVLLILVSRRAWVGRELCNGPLAVIVLVLSVLIFVAAAAFEIARRLGL